MIDDQSGDLQSLPYRLFLISAPSGTGKTTLIRALINRVPHLVRSISYTTRIPRPGEIDGECYNFICQKRFHDMIKNGDFLEYAEICGNFYGTSLNSTLEGLKVSDFIMEMDFQGAQRMREIKFPLLSVFILPPDYTELESRLKKRNKDGNGTIQNRLKWARDEIKHASEYDYLLINDDFNRTIESLITIVNASRLEFKRQVSLQNFAISTIFESFT